MKKPNIVRSFIIMLIPAITACSGLNDPFYNSYGNNGYNNNYYDPYYGNSYNNQYQIDQARRETQELRRERERAEEERRRLERERDNVHNRPPPISRPAYESCPSGFSPSERKCSSDERRRGCRDIRLPGGLGCVSR